MRITDSAVISDFLANISRSKNRINRLNTQLSSGKKILKVSDDPTTSSTLLRLNQHLDRITQYKNNVVDGQNTLKVTATSLGEVASRLGEAKNILTGALTSGDQSLLGTLANHIDDIRSHCFEIANSNPTGTYIFGGTQTWNPPFVQTGTPPQVTYHGNTGAIQCQIGDGVSQIVNVSGAAAFNSTGFIDLNGALDPNAAVNTVVNQTVSITDGNGVAHNVTMSMTKTASNTWAIAAAMPPGSTDANLSGGAATVTFDPANGAIKDIVRGAPLMLSPTGATPGQTAPPLNMLYTAAGVSESAPAGGSSIAGTQRNVSIFNRLAEISTNLRNGIKPTTDDTAILDTMQNVVMREEARAGSYASNLTTTSDFLTAQSDSLLTLFSSKQDSDPAEIGMRLTQEQVMLDATLSAAAKIIPKSLVDFLK